MAISRGRQRVGAGSAFLVAALTGLTATAPQAQLGHRITADQVRVDRASHWQQWQGASSLIDITVAGITPVFVRKDINAALDADRFAITTADPDTPGGVTVLSNPGLASNVHDGDLTTSWGPDPDSPLDSWWLELNLGRLVVAKKIVIHFAAEGDGDPFLQFKLMGWRLPPPRSTTKYLLTGTDIPRFWEIGRTSRPNKTQRTFEFIPRPTETADEDFEGDALDRILIAATSSDFQRGVEVTAAEYEGLPARQRGAIDHYRREVSGRESLVSAQEYEDIDEARRGSIRYFRRELPRIAEIEVLTEGDNINLGLVERGGAALVQTLADDFKSIPTAADGDYSTGHSSSIFEGEPLEYLQDMGALFWVDSMHFLLDGATTIDEWPVEVSDGTRAPDGSIQYTPILQGRTGVLPPSSVRFRTVSFAPRKVRYLRSIFGKPTSRGYIGITEILMYGAGFVPEVPLTSDLILFGDSKNLISIEWEGDAPEGTTIQLQSRTGNQLQEEKIYFDSNGNEVTESRFNRLPSSRKGEVQSRFLPGADWSAWSTPYTESGAEFASPSPRQYMQLRATLVTDREDAAASLRSIVVNMSDPVAERLVGEVWPLRVGRVGDEEEFSFFLRPDFASALQGFDEIRLDATAGTRMRLLSARYGTDADFDGGTTTELSLADLEPVSAAGDTLHLRLPRVRRGTDVVEVRFRAAILANSASFRAFVRESGEQTWQRVDEGDATAMVSSQRVTVLALEGSRIINDLRLDSPAFSPNGDRVNDELVVRFSVARVNSARPVALVVRDLAGRLVRRIEDARADSRGDYAMTWDGTDSGGTLVPPGIYLAEIDVDVDAGSARQSSRTRLVHVAY